MPTLANKNECVGCTACVSICSKKCIEMKTDEYGFSYPEFVFPDNCIKCGLCENVCPIINAPKISDNLPDVYAAYSLDEENRINSSSGGIFSEIAKKVISKNGVVYGAAYNDNFEVYHCFIDNINDLQKLRGAKYSESNLGNCYIDIKNKLKSGQLVLFSGTPCQIAGLKSFLTTDYDNLICIDFVCHGIPSPMAWQKYIEYRATKDSDGDYPININLRSKITGWSKYKYCNLFEYQNGQNYCELSTQSLYMKLFVGDYISRTSCDNCKFKGYKRISDITLGDFWGIWDIAPEMDDNKGISVLLIHSNKGKILWTELSSYIKYKSVSIKQASQHNPSMLISSRSNINRNILLNSIKAGKIESCNELFTSDNQKKASILTKVKSKIKSLLYN